MDLKAERTKRIEEVKSLLKEFKKNLDRYEELESPHWGHIGDLNSMAGSLKQFLNNE